jgi:radical SAM superfamily enzyme YgiQ (UPF0313 family)
MPLGLMCLSACLTDAGIENEIIDIKGDPAANRRNIEAVERSQPCAVGITVVSTEIFEVRDLCAEIRKVAPHTKIILGGPGPTYRPDHYITANVDADYQVLGEADFTFVEVMKALVEGRAPDAEGTYAMSDPALTQRCVKRPMVDDLSTLPYPAYDKVDMDFYCRPSVWAVRFVYAAGLSIMTSRGCPFTCKFCVVPNIYGRTIRLRTAEQTVTQVQYLQDTFGIDVLFWLDEVFTGNKKWALEVCRLIKERNVKIKWGCQTRAHLTEPGLLKTMADAGCIQIDTGYESGSDRMLDVIDKGVKATADLYMTFSQNTRAAGLRHLGNMMINLPTETMEDVEQSITFIEQARPNVVLWGPYIPIPGISFGHEMALEDMHLYGENRAETAVLEDKYKYATYDTPLKDVIHRLHKLFPYPPDINWTLNPVYWWRWGQYFSYIFTGWYWWMVATSKRRRQYFQIGQMLRQEVSR